MRELKKPQFSMAGWGLFLAGALTLSSCSNEDLPGGEEQGPAIEFGKVESRADANAVGFDKFGVFAQMNLGADGTEKAAEYIDLLTNEKVYFVENTADGETPWKYDNIRYWITERTFQFFAYTPYVEEGVTSSAVSIPVPTTLNEKAGYQIAFSTPSTADVDLMVDHKTQPILANPTSYPTVTFDFKHTLSKIGIKVAKASGNADNKVVVKLVTLANVKKDGTYYTSGHNEYTDNWVTDAPTSFTKSTDMEIAPTATDVLGEGNEFLLIPQTITGDANGIQVSVNYDFYDPIYQENEDGTTTITSYKREGNYTVSGTLPILGTERGESKWEESKRYTYNIQLSPKNNNILFGTPTISNDWDVEKQIGGTIIIQ